MSVDDVTKGAIETLRSDAEHWLEYHPLRKAAMLSTLDALAAAVSRYEGAIRAKALREAIAVCRARRHPGHARNNFTRDQCTGIALAEGIIEEFAAEIEASNDTESKGGA